MDLWLAIVLIVLISSTVKIVDTLTQKKDKTVSDKTDLRIDEMESKLKKQDARIQNLESLILEQDKEKRFSDMDN
ncbi:MAG: hypothetical protein K9K78_04680 [Spirochaetales bacterium]|nr:hypothetical protein [Spirochaetales bacterium]